MSLAIVRALGHKEYAFMFAAIGSWELLNTEGLELIAAISENGMGGKELNHSFIDVWLGWLRFILP